MDQMLNEETRPDAEAQRPRKKTQKQNRLPIQLPEFLNHIGEDVRWYYDVRLWSPLILVLLILALLVPVRRTKAEPAAPETPAVMETLPAAETEPVPEPLIPEAVALARLADSVGAGRSANARTIIMWVAINRSEDQANGYGKPLLEEIARPDQWQFYDPNAPYSEETYQIAKDVLETKRNGGLRPLDGDMLWLVLNDDGSVTTRNQFTATANQKWREKTVK